MKPSILGVVSSVVVFACSAAAQQSKNKINDSSPALVPVGACCIQSEPNQPYACIEITQAGCLDAGGIYHGNGSACGIDPCPATGACCYIAPGVVGFQCTITSEAHCYQLPLGVYFGDNTTCAPTPPCPSCIFPPKQLAAWWTFDEFLPGFAYDSVAANHGTKLPLNSGPSVFSSHVANFLSFDGVDDSIRIPHSNSITIGSQDFTIDAWVVYVPTGTAECLFNKSASNLLSAGYFYGVNGNGNPFFVIDPGSFFPTLHTSSVVMPTGVWTHMAVTGTVIGNQRTLRFYVNGLLTDTIPGVQAFIADAPTSFNNGIAYIGAYQGGGYFWKGYIDEVELHLAALSPADIAAIYAVDTHGKCKTQVWPQNYVPLCLNQTVVNVPIQLFNGSSASYQYNLSFSSLNACSVPGPTVFTPLFTNPVTVPPLSWVTVQVAIQRPAGLNAALQTACYLVTATDTSNSRSYYGQASLVDRRDLCAMIDPCCIVDEIGIGVTDPNPFSISITNTSPNPINSSLVVQVLDSIDHTPSQFVSLNGLPPGTRYIGDLVLAPNQAQPVNFEIRYLQHHPVGHDELVISTDVDGDGILEPLRSIGMHSLPQLCPGDIAPVDADGGSSFSRDGSVNIQDLTEIILHWGTADPNADIDHDGVVNILDLTSIILSWGSCP